MKKDNISSLRNLGEKSQLMLNAVGIYTYEDLLQRGSVKTYLDVKREGLKPGLNLLYALEGALQDTRWNKLSKEN